MTIRAVFLDRDGVLNTHLPGDYVKSAETLVVLPGVAQAVRRLNDAGLPVAVISNQQGVGKGVMTIEDLQQVEQRIIETLDAEAGAYISRFYYCTDLKEANSPRRKPEPGMLWEAADDFGLNITETVFAGDTPTDIAAGHAAGVAATLLLLSGSTKSYAPGDFALEPNYVFTDLQNAVNWILENKT